jgi:hypothetical protein
VSLSQRFGYFAAVVALVCTIGCGGPSGTPVETQTISVAELIRNDLKMTAQNGQLGSEMSSIQDNLVKYREENPAAAAELQSDLEKLQGLSGAQATAKANEMIAKVK